jgi:hypothetical protein
MVWYAFPMAMVCISLPLYGIHWKWYGMVWYALELAMVWYAMVWYALEMEMEMAMLCIGMVSIALPLPCMVFIGNGMVWYALEMVWYALAIVFYGMVCIGNGNGNENGMHW